MFPGYRAAPHHHALATALERVERGECKRLMVFMPPRHGKSELVSVRFPAWYLGRHPEQRFIGTSYAARLAERFSGQARNQFSDERWPYGVSLATDTQSKATWDIAGHRGGYIAAGVGGPITGQGGHMIVIDDPVKNREEADSQVTRDSIWDWYQSTLYTRLEEDGAIILVMCMTGGTPVLMADGSEKPLRYICPGDRIATYDDGKISVSTVRNWADQGPDAVFEIRMKSGITVKANARHPFLVKTARGLEWQRTASICKGSVILRVIGANGAASLAQKTGAISQRNAGACACPTTTRISGAPAIDLRRSILSRGVRHAYATATGLLQRSMIAYSRNRAVSAQSAETRQSQGRIYAPTGQTNCASTIAMRAEKSGACSATTATSSLATAETRPLCSPPLNTYEVVEDIVCEVVEAGVENVFDIEVERTGNFIANGLVSHNTRWHEDDLAGRLLNEAKQGGDQWEVIELPAIDAGGNALWPEKYDASRLTQIRQTIGSRNWTALYQQRPTLEEGAMFKRAWFTVVDEAPWKLRWTRYWDLAASTKTSADFTVSASIAIDDDGTLWIRDVIRGRWEWPDARKVMKDTMLAETGNTSHVVEEALHGIAALQELRRDPQLHGIPLYGYRVDKDKVTRAMPWAARAEAGKVRLVRGEWVNAFLDEVCAFPLAAHDDQVDAVSGAVACHNNRMRQATIQPVRYRPPSYTGAKVGAHGR